MKWFIRYTGWMFYFAGLMIVETIKFPINFLRFSRNTNKTQYNIQVAPKNNTTVDPKRATSDWVNGPYYKG